MNNFTLLLAAALFVCASANPLQKTVLNEILRINSAQNSWKAGLNDISLWTLADILKLLGALKITDFEEKDDIKAADNIPDTFDARSQWPECESISSIKDQGSCGSCWAVAAASAASDRLCIESNSQMKFNLSAQDLMTCCSKCAPDGGCNGGYPNRAWQFIKNTGIVTGGDYKSNEGCKPYDVSPTGASPLFPTRQSCKRSCTNKKYQGNYSGDKHKGASSYSLPNDVAKIQTDLMNHGPSEAAFDVYDDFMHYKSGVYVRSSNKYLGGHAVRLLGWGTENGVAYWLAANSWNTTWGDNGTFKIRRGTNECNFEQEITAGLMSK